MRILFFLIGGLVEFEIRWNKR